MGLCVAPIYIYIYIYVCVCVCVCVCVLVVGVFLRQGCSARFLYIVHASGVCVCACVRVRPSVRACLRVCVCYTLFLFSSACEHIVWTSPWESVFMCLSINRRYTASHCVFAGRVPHEWWFCTKAQRDMDLFCVVLNVSSAFQQSLSNTVTSVIISKYSACT